MDNETFTICLDADGQPVQRPLGAMTADEVLAALAFHQQCAFLAHSAHEQADCVMTNLRFGGREPTGIEVTAQIDATAHIMAQAATATGKNQRLCAAVQAILRQKLGYPGYPELHFSMPLEEIVRLHWSDAAHSVS